ncbi:MAG: winged helix-turn-helix domain-containing protein [Steroidobacteraceae bacterium]
MDVEPPAREEVLAFGPFRLFMDKRVLLDDRGPVRLGGRAMDLLIALVERAGETVGKNELLHRAWASSVVEDNTLRVHIAAVRRLLGEGHRGERYIINVAGRGYSFVAPVTRLNQRAAVAPAAVGEAALPHLTTRVLGRDEDIKSVLKLLLVHRLVTVLGPGGIGKTTVALAVAERLANETDTKVRFVDLSGVTDAAMVPGAIAAAVGLSTASEDPIQALIEFLQGSTTLLIFDNCEHVIVEAARVVERLLRGAREVAVLGTSRERLLAQSEAVYTLPPLQCPPPSEVMTAGTALKYSAVRLFAERAISAQETFDITDRNAATVVAICRGLDCSPLGIELVAARVGVLDIEMIASSLSRSLLLFSQGRRAGVDRHQSLAAALGWSFDLLSRPEQTLLRRLATFSGSFSAQSAMTVCSGPDLPQQDVPDGLMSLVGKSLLMADTSDSTLRFRLLHVTRAFATHQLVQAGEDAICRRRHAEHFSALLSSSDERNPVSADSDDVHAALQWAFGESGDATIAARLFVAAIPFVVEFSMQDFEARSTQTLAILAAREESDLRAQFRVRTARASMFFQVGAPEEKLKAEIAVMLSLSERIEEPMDRLSAYAARAIVALELVDYVGAVQSFEAVQALARQMDDGHAAGVADRVGAQVFHWVGDQANARIRAERVLRSRTIAAPRTFRRAPVDRGVAMRVVLARAAWLEGRADSAMELAREALQLTSEEVPVSLCHALAFAACPIALWRGDRDEAARFIEQLVDHSRRHNFRRWHRLGLCFKHSLLAGSGEGIESATPMGSLQRDLLGTIDERWADDSTLARAELGLAGWCNAELIRVAGERILLQVHPRSIEAAEVRFETALRFSRDQQTLAWELRAATSLARLLLSEGARAAAREVLGPVCERVTQGAQTHDLLAAKALLRSA